MSAKTTTTASATTTTGKDPTLDFFSPQFDPLRALSTPGVRPPVANAVPLTHVGKCRVLLDPTDPNYAAPPPPPPPPPSAQAQSTPSSSSQSSSSLSSSKGIETTVADKQRPAVEKNLPHPLVYFSSEFREPAAITIEKYSKSKQARQCGPMALLRTLCAEGCRVRVTVRRIDGVRGTCVGFLRAFDKHWNMLLLDVEETFTQRFRVAKVDDDNDNDDKAGVAHRHRRHSAATRSTIELTKHAHYHQLIVRGEHVVLITRAALAAPVAVPQVNHSLCTAAASATTGANHPSRLPVQTRIATEPTRTTISVILPSQVLPPP